MIDPSLWLGIAGFLALLQSFLLVLQAYEHRRFAAGRLRAIASAEAAGQALVIIPCRGKETDLEANLACFFQQDYPAYILRFVVESENDPAVAVIRGLMQRFPAVRSELVIAGLAENEAQKVHNLRTATAEIPPGIDYLVFADSDAAPQPHWLRTILSRLRASGAAAVTGYRWFIPEKGSFHEAVVYSLNGAYTMLMSRNTPNLVWGGSWAVCRQTFDKLHIRERWQGCICDDLAAAAEFLKHGLHVEYEPACLVGTACQPSARELFAFAQRQFFLLRHVLPQWWLVDCLVGYAHVLVFWVICLLMFVTANRGVQVVAGLSVLLLYAMQWARAELRASVTRLHFPALADGPAFRRVFWWDRLLGPLILLLGFVACLSGGLRRRIAWRGIVYRIGHHGRVRVQHPSPAIKQPSPDLTGTIAAENPLGRELATPHTMEPARADSPLGAVPASCQTTTAGANPGTSRTATNHAATAAA